MPNKKLTEKQIRFIYFYMRDNGNATESARLAGYKGNDVTLGAVGAENLKKPLIITEIERLRIEAGITPELAAKRHKELLDAERTVYITTITKTKKGKDTTVEEAHKEPDKTIRLGALHLYYKKEGKLTHKVEHSGKIDHEHHLEKEEIGGIFENIRKAARLGILNLPN